MAHAWCLLAGLATSLALNPSFTAYDCSNPLELNSLPREDCTLLTRSGSVKQVLIAQMKTTYPVLGHTCQLTQSRTVAYCGHYSANKQTNILAQDSSLTISTEDCKQAVSENFLLIMDQKINVTTLSGTNRLTFTKIGSISYTSTNVECQGGQVRMESGILVDNMIELIQLNLLILPRTLLANNDHILEEGTGAVIAQVSDKGLADPSHRQVTVWDIPAPTCPLRTIFRGVGEISNKVLLLRKNKAAFIQRNLRPINIPHCKGNYFQATIRNVFFTFSPNQILTEILPAEIELDIQQSARFSYLYEVWLLSVDARREKLTSADCARQAAGTHRSTELVQVAQNMDNASYIANRGDFILELTCPRVLTEYRNTKSCYMELPVTYNDSDWFITPKTHTLTKTPTSTICSQLNPVYQALNSLYYTQTPYLRVISPDPLVSREPTDGGIFSEEQMESYRTWRRAAFAYKKVIKTIKTQIVASPSAPNSITDLINFPSIPTLFENPLQHLDSLLTLVSIGFCVTLGLVAMATKYYQLKGEEQPSFLKCIYICCTSCTKLHLARKNVTTPTDPMDIEMQEIHS